MIKNGFDTIETRNISQSNAFDVDLFTAENKKCQRHWKFTLNTCDFFSTIKIIVVEYFARNEFLSEFFLEMTSIKVLHLKNEAKKMKGKHKNHNGNEKMQAKGRKNIIH